jgi:hypothetical protein
MRLLYCLLLALAIFETGCAAQPQAQNSDPMLQREDSKVHGEVGVADFLIQKTDGERITIKISFARADGGDDDKNDIENMQDGEQNESDQH